MPRVKRAQVTTTEPPAKPATSTPAEKKNGHNGNAKATFDLETTIRARAYELYEKRGRQDGYAQDDWLQAETEVRSQYSRTA
jgi:Protein of unknown function (DUF2934)